MPTALEKLIDLVISDRIFQENYGLLEEVSASQQVLNNDNANLDANKVGKIIKASSLISLSPKESHKKIAQKLNALLFGLYNDNQLVNYTIQILSSRLGNVPAITQSAVFRENNIYSLIDDTDGEQNFLFDPEIIANLNSERYLSEWILNQKSYYFNLEQRNIIDVLNKKSLVSFSAPTSFGKSFVVRFHIARLYSESRLGRILIIVPTKSLIDDFLESFLELKRNLNLGFSLKTHARNVDEENTPAECIFILTQERASFLLSRNPDFVKTFDLIYCDEAHYIARGYRGFVLRAVLKRLIETCGVSGLQEGGAKYIFTSPLIKNPNYYQLKLFSNLPTENTFHADITYSPVEKNLYIVEKGENQYQYFLLKESLADKTFKKRLYKIGPLTNLQFTDAINDEDISKDVAIVTNRQIAGKNILYVTSPILAHKYGLALARLLNDTEYIEDPEVLDIRRYISDHFSQDFNLFEMIKKGVGLHYGPMPVGLRRAMVQLYEKGKLKYLICTSTLLEGVNLPANNIFIFSANHGGSKHTPLSFWNLVGRAGRITYGLSGNVICIGKKVNDYKKLIENKESEIEDPEKESLQTSTRQIRLIESFTQNSYQYTRSDIREDLEYLIYELLTKPNTEAILKSTSLNEQQIIELLPYVAAAKNRLELPIEIIEQNPGIDPRLQDNLYRALNTAEGRNKLSEFLSIAQNPRGVTGEKIFQMLEATHLELKWPSNSFDAVSISRKIAQWLQEMSIADFVRQRTRHSEATGTEGYFQKIEWAVKVIRDLETSVSFLAPKYLKCLLDVSLFIMREEGYANEDSLDTIERFLFSIEAGVSSIVARYLYEKGVSRNIAIKAGNIVEEDIISEGFDDGFFNRDSVKEKLRNNLSAIAYRELMDHLD